MPLPFTDYCQGVFNCAVKQAGPDQADIIVLSIINSSNIESVEKITALGYDVDAEHYVESLKNERKEKLSVMVKHAGFDKKRVKIMFKIGNPVDEILQVIKKENPDLVVMGTRGRSKLQTSIMGTVAEKVFKKSPVTVLSYRDEDVRQKMLRRLDF